MNGLPPEPKNVALRGRALAGAWRKGARATQAAPTLGAWPCGDARMANDRVTFSRAFAKAWREGWRWAGACGDRLRLLRQVAALSTSVLCSFGDVVSALDGQVWATLAASCGAVVCVALLVEDQP